MNITAKILKSKIMIECKNKPITYEIGGPKIGKIIDSKIEDNSLIVTIKINRNWNKRINELFKSGLHANYEIKNKNDKCIFNTAEIKPAKIERM